MLTWRFSTFNLLHREKKENNTWRRMIQEEPTARLMRLSTNRNAVFKHKARLGEKSTNPVPGSGLPPRTRSVSHCTSCSRTRGCCGATLFKCVIPVKLFRLVVAGSPPESRGLTRILTEEAPRCQRDKQRRVSPEESVGCRRRSHLAVPLAPELANVSGGCLCSANPPETRGETCV